MTENTIESGFKCDICGKTFKSKGSLYVHKSKYHKNKVDKVSNKVFDKVDDKLTDNLSDKINNTLSDKVSKEPIEVTSESFSQEDLNKVQQDLLANDETVKSIKQIVENMTEEDGKELYLMLMDIVGGMSGVDIEADIPNIEERAKKRGKYLAFTINRYIPQIEQYIIPVILVGGIATDVLSIRKLGKLKKAMDKANKEGDKK